MLTAIINEALCVGCSRCIPACPVDAIVGSHRFTHTVLLDECIGCKLCLAPCPVDCIEMHPLDDFRNTQGMGPSLDKSDRAEKAKRRHQAKLKRLQKEALPQLPVYGSSEVRKQHIQREIQASLERTRKINPAKLLESSAAP